MQDHKRSGVSQLRFASPLGDSVLCLFQRRTTEMGTKFLSRLFGPAFRAVKSMFVSEDRWRGVATLADLPESLGSLLQAPADVRQNRVEILANRLRELQDSDLVELDIEARRWYYAEDGRKAWWAVRPQDIGILLKFTQTSGFHIVGLLSFHPSGHVREAALRELGELGAPEALPYLLLRLNDWADPVVQLAQDLLPRIAALQSGASVLEHMDMVLKLQRSTRRNHAPWVDHFLDYLSQPEQGDVLFQGLRSPSLPTRRLCFDLALKTGALTGLALLGISQGEPDPIIRRKVQRAVLSHARPEELEEILSLALRDPVPSCRRAALEWLEETQSPDREGHCREALLDRSRSVRETARWTLRQLGVGSVREPYLAALRSSKQAQQVIGIHGLGEVGQKEDAILVEPFSQSPISNLRNAAITALGRLDAKGYTALFLDAMASDHPGTSRLGTEILLQNGPWPNRDWLRGLYRSTPHGHVRRRVLSFVHKLPKWQGMAFFLDVMPTNPEDIDPSMALHLDKWLRSLLRVPPPQGTEREEAKARLWAARERLGWRVLPEVDGQLE